MADPGSHKRVIFSAFDAYPGLKGAQAHIRMNLRALADSGREATLLCLGRGQSFRDDETGALVHPFEALEDNILRRTERFGQFLSRMADDRLADPPGVIHFRDIWSGIPLLSHPISRNARFIFEVNGLPSVEMPGHYPLMSRNPSLLRRLLNMEDECLALSHRIITVCRRTADYLAERGCDPKKIAIIPNAVDHQARDLPSRADPFLFADRKTILYTGTLSPWQGLHNLLDAMMLLVHRKDLHLLVVFPGRKGVDRFRRQINRKGLIERVTIREGIPHTEMLSLYSRVFFSVAPLSRGVRNEVQGCCPLKIVESMAAGTPVLASDLPVVREILRPGEGGLLVPPDSPRSLAKAIETLLDDEPLRERLGRGAYERARRDFGTELYRQKLNQIYAELTGG